MQAHAELTQAGPKGARQMFERAARAEFSSGRAHERPASGWMSRLFAGDQPENQREMRRGAICRDSPWGDVAP
jgi:hypothetical protein